MARRCKFDAGHCLEVCEFLKVCRKVVRLLYLRNRGKGAELPEQWRAPPLVCKHLRPLHMLFKFSDIFSNAGLPNLKLF